MIPYIGDFAEDVTLVHYFNTFDSNDPSASVTITNLASTDLYVHKDGVDSTETTTGATIDIDFDSITGTHKVTVDTSSDAFYATGSDYMVRMEGTTVDAGTINAALFTFSIENRYNAAADDLANGTDGLGALLAACATATGFATPTNITAAAGIAVTSIGANVITATAIQDGAIDAATFATDAIDASALATDAVNEIVDAVWDEDIADHVAVGTTGQAQELSAYIGPSGTGVYINDGAANTNTVAGEDGTASKPVSTMTAARTIADALGIQRYYFTGVASAMDINATHEDWHFMGLCATDSNILDFASADVDRSLFENLTLQGPQAGAARITAINCILQNDGSGTTEVHIHAIRCGLASSDPGILIANNDDHIFEACYSMVSGNGAPMIDAQSGANVDLSIRHYSGGVEFKGLAGSSTTSIETDGQVIFNATNTTTAPVTIRGNCTVTDNATMTSVTEDARIDVAQINAQVDSGIETYGLDHLVSASVTGSDVADDSIIAMLVDDAATADWDNYDNTTASFEALNVDTDAILADTNELQTDDIPTLIAAIQTVVDKIPLSDGSVSWNSTALAAINAEVDTALDTAISELGVAAPTATPTMRTGLMLLYMALRNKTVVQTSGTDALEIYNNAGTKIASKLLTDDGSDYTEAEMA